MSLLGHFFTLLGVSGHREDSQRQHDLRVEYLVNCAYIFPNRVWGKVELVRRSKFDL